MKYKLLNPSTTVDQVPVDFKIDNFMLRGAMSIFKFSCLLSRSIWSDFVIISLEKSCSKTIVETSRPDISPALHANLLTYQLAYISISSRMVIFDVKVHDSWKPKFYRCTRRILSWNCVQQLNILFVVRCTFEFFFTDFQVNSSFFWVCSKCMFRLTYEMLITENSINLLFQK